MSSLKLALVIDKSEAFLSFQKERILTAWGAEPSATKKIERFTQAGGAMLFGGGVTSILEIDEAEGLKQLVSDLEAAEGAGTLANKLSEGVLILSTVPRTSTKKAEALVAKLGGEVVTTAVDKKERITVAEKLVQGLNLNRDARTFLLAYVGDDYEAVIPLTKTLSTLTPEQQFRVSEEDLFLRLPQAPGAVPPWEIEKPLFAGDFDKTIDVFRRVSQHSHYLVVLKVLNNKFQLAFRVAALMEVQNVKTTSQLAESLGVPDNYPLKLAMGYAKKYGLAKLQQAAHEMARTEAQVKGGSGANGTVLMELMLVRMISMFRG